MKIGFIGLGNMGQAMARNIARAGHQIPVYNRIGGRADELRAEGARVADSLCDAALNAEVLITMLANTRRLSPSSSGLSTRQANQGAARFMV